MNVELPALVSAATQRARSAGFGLSCTPEVGRLLAVLAAMVPHGGAVLELGTGVGVGTAWLVSGLLPRADTRVITVECDGETAVLAAAADWPAFVELRHEDALDVLAGAGTFDLIFADAQGGKWEGLDRTVAALRPGAALVVDDMTPQPHWSQEMRVRQDGVRRTLLTHPLLSSVELAHGSGVILCARRVGPAGPDTGSDYSSSSPAPR